MRLRSSISSYKEKSNTVVFFDKQYKITTGFFTENTIVVAEGQMLLEGIFKVSCGFFIGILLDFSLTAALFSINLLLLLIYLDTLCVATDKGVFSVGYFNHTPRNLKK